MFIHLSVSGHLGCSTFLALINTAAVDTGVQISCGDSAFNSLGYIPINGIGGSRGHSIFNFSWNCQTMFHSSHTIFHALHQRTRGLISSHPCHHLVLAGVF